MFRYWTIHLLFLLFISMSVTSCSWIPFFQSDPEPEAFSSEALEKEFFAIADSFNAGGFRYVIDRFELLAPSMKKNRPLDLPWAYNTQGMAYFYLEQNDSASFLFSKAIQADPTYAEPYNNKGHMFLLQSEIDSAIIYFTRSLTLKPDYDAARLNLEIAQKFKSGEFDWNNLEIMAMADSTTNLEEKVRLYSQLVNLAPYYVEIYNNLGVALYKTGNINDAFKQLNAAIIIDPAYAMAHNNLGYLYHEYGLFDDAIKHYLIAIRLKFNFLTALENLAFTYQTIGEFEKAEQVLATVLEVEPDRQFAIDLLNEVKNKLQVSKRPEEKTEE